LFFEFTGRHVKTKKCCEQKTETNAKWRVFCRAARPTWRFYLSVLLFGSLQHMVWPHWWLQNMVWPHWWLQNNVWLHVAYNDGTNDHTLSNMRISITWANLRTRQISNSFRSSQCPWLWFEPIANMYSTEVNFCCSSGCNNCWQWLLFSCFIMILECFYHSRGLLLLCDSEFARNEPYLLYSYSVNWLILIVRLFWAYRLRA